MLHGWCSHSSCVIPEITELLKWWEGSSLLGPLPYFCLCLLLMYWYCNLLYIRGPSWFIKNYIFQYLPQRMFGEFYCQYCHYGWSSGNAWAGKGQQCKMCQRMVLPRSLRPLNAQPYDSDKDRKPHKRNLCQKCQELGYDCRNHVPSLSRHPSTTSVATNRRQQRSTAIAGATFRTKQTTTITSSTDLNCAIL